MASETRSAPNRRAAFRGLSTPVKIMLLGSLVNRFGNGLIMPFTVVYLHNSVGISLAVTGTLMGAFGVAGLLVTPLAGSMVDKVGNRRTLALSLVLLALGYGGLAFVNGSVIALITLVVAGAGNGVFWPSHKALLAALSPPGRRHIAFSFEQMAGNVGIGVGGLIGGVLLGLDGASHGYAVLFIVDAVTFVLFMLLLPRTVVTDPPATDGAADVADEVGDQEAGWGAIFRNRAMRRLLSVQLFVVMFGIVGIEQMMPLYLKNFGGVSASLLGILYATNVVAYVLLQLPVARTLEGRRRASSLSLGVASWGVLWLVIAAVTGLASGVVVLVVTSLVAGMYAVGESVITVVVDPTVGDIAPPQLMGRFMSALTLMWNFGLIIGPILGGAIMEIYPSAMWPVFAAALFFAAVMARRLQDDLPPSRQLIESQ